ncbi:hypothetical protein PJM27_29460, partial [Mycobacterium kansasii]
AALAGLVAVIIGVLAAIGSAAAAVVLGIPLVLVVLAALVYLYTVVLFAPVLIALSGSVVAVGIGLWLPWLIFAGV